jgi:hypothetical protein
MPLPVSHNSPFIPRPLMFNKPSLAPGYCRLPTLVTVGLAVGHPGRVDSTNGRASRDLGDLLRSAGVEAPSACSDFVRWR